MDITLLSEEKRAEVVARLTSRTYRTPSGCERWKGSHSRDGYARTSVRINGRKYVREAHRLLWLLTRGAIGEGYYIDHLCRVRDCLNLDHMELVSHSTNTFRGTGITSLNKQKTHCIRGHKFTEENIYRSPSMPNSRQCIKCMRMREKKRVR